MEELDLSDNALGIKGIRACQPALEAPAALRRLYLCNDGISAEACELIHDLLLQGAGESGNCPLTALHFFNNMSGEGGGLAIGKLLARCSAMESFRMSSTRCTPAGGAAILRGLQATSALRTLDLSDNTLGTESGPLVADLLRAQPGLASLHLGDTSLEASGVVEVADALATSCPALTYLNLSCNESGADGALALARALRQGTPQLKELHMEVCVPPPPARRASLLLAVCSAPHACSRPRVDAGERAWLPRSQGGGARCARPPGPASSAPGRERDRRPRSAGAGRLCRGLPRPAGAAR